MRDGSRVSRGMSAASAARRTNIPCGGSRSGIVGLFSPPEQRAGSSFAALKLLRVIRYPVVAPSENRFHLLG